MCTLQGFLLFDTFAFRVCSSINVQVNPCRKLDKNLWFIMNTSYCKSITWTTWCRLTATTFFMQSLIIPLVKKFCSPELRQNKTGKFLDNIKISRSNCLLSIRAKYLANMKRDEQKNILTITKKYTVRKKNWVYNITKKCLYITKTAFNVNIVIQKIFQYSNIKTYRYSVKNYILGL